VDDTKTLRESQSSVGSQGTRSARDSTIGSTAFEFDTSLRETAPYRAAVVSRNVAHNTSPVRLISRKSVGSRPVNEDGYQTGTPLSEQRTADLSRNLSSDSGLGMTAFPNHTRRRSELDNVNIYRSGSITATSTASEPAIHRWLYSSSSTDSPPVENDPSALSSRKFWPSRLKRLNTFGATKLASPKQRTQSVGANFGAGQGRRRNQEKNITQSIDFTSADELETPHLIRVAQAGNAVEIERLLDNGDGIEAQHILTQRTALGVAAHCGNAEVVRLLLRCEANPNTRDYQWSTPLHLASSRGHCKVMELLLLNDDVDIEAVDQSKQTALWVAADRGHLKAVEILLKRGAKINVRANEQLTPLHTAARQGDKAMIELLLRHKGHIEARDSNSMTALHHACETGHELVVDFLLQKGASIDTPGKDKKSPLIFAAASGQYNVVTLLSKR